MSVYFIRAGAAGPIKIGSAVDTQRRMQELQVGSHEELLLIGTEQGGIREEKAWHMKMRKHRVRGEWFAADPVLHVLGELWNCRWPTTEMGWRFPCAQDYCPECDSDCYSIKHGKYWPTDIQDEAGDWIRFGYTCDHGHQWSCGYSKRWAVHAFAASGSVRGRC